MSAYKTAAVAKQQASKKFGKNWENDLEILETEEGFVISAKQQPEAVQEVAPVVVANSTEEELEESPVSTGPSMLAGLVGNMLDPKTVPAAPVASKQQPEKTGKTIEQNRAEQNGLKRPSKGSTCAIIWDTCDKITKDEHICTSAELFNALQGYNECTLRTQYARWRQFNGITGRLPGQNKTAKLPAEFDDAKDVLMSRIDQEMHPESVAELTAAKSPAELIAWIANNATKF